jgi:hypothetical protein
MRYTRFRFALAPTPEQARTLARYCGGSRFAFSITAFSSLPMRLPQRRRLQITAACGLEDLLQGVCRRNPRRVSVEWYRHRVLAKQVATRWPNVQIHW